jgi:iron complex outermembrane recepter protein
VRVYASLLVCFLGKLDSFCGGWSCLCPAGAMDGLQYPDRRRSVRSQRHGLPLDRSPHYVGNHRIGCGSDIRQARTDSAGHFTVNLPQGAYHLQVSAAGFATYDKDLSISPSSPIPDVTLAVQNASNSVTVQVEAGYVASDSTLGTKTDTPLLETPQTISVITRDEMDAQAPQSINEAVRYAPGIVAESQGTTSSFWNSSSLQLRGFIPSLYQDGLTDDATGNTLLDAYFYQRIEVLEGPSSVLYGQGNPAGIVNVESKRLMATSLHELQLGLGTYGRYEGNYDFGGLFSRLMCCIV